MVRLLGLIKWSHSYCQNEYYCNDLGSKNLCEREKLEFGKNAGIVFSCHVKVFRC